MGSFWARLSLGEACTKYQSRTSLSTLWYIRTSASRISPVRGSLTCGPKAFSVVEGSQRMVEYAGILRVPVGVFAARRGILADDRVLEAGRLEGRLPHLDALL